MGLLTAFEWVKAALMGVKYQNRDAEQQLAAAVRFGAGPGLSRTSFSSFLNVGE